MKRLISLGILLSIFSCGPRRGSPGLSSSIIDAKAKKVYVSSYRVVGNVINVDGEIYEIQSAWSERSWRYGKYIGSEIVVIPEYSSIQINFSSDLPLKSYKKSWTLGVNTQLLFNQSSLKSIFATINHPLSDTISVPIQRGIELDQKRQEIIGEVILIKVY